MTVTVTTAARTDGLPSTFNITAPNTLSSSYNTTSSTYADIDATNLSFASVPNNSAVIAVITVRTATSSDESTVRLTDGTNTFASKTFVQGDPNTDQAAVIQGVQNSGGAATVKLQWKRDIGTNVVVIEINAVDEGVAMATWDNQDDPLIVNMTNNIIEFPMKVSLTDIQIASLTNVDSQDAAVMGCNGAVANHNSISEITTIDNIVNSFVITSTKTAAVADAGGEHIPVLALIFWEGTKVTFT